MADYGIWLSYNNQQEGFRVPVNPSKISVSNSSNNSTNQIIGLGDISILNDPKLNEYSFESFFPVGRYSFNSTDLLLTPQEYIDFIIRWQRNKFPIRIVFKGSTWNINQAVSIESFDYEEGQDFGVGNVKYSIKFKKYVFYAAQKISVNINQETGQTTIEKQSPNRPDDREVPSTHVLLAGESLWTVAQKELGNGSRYKEIQTLNNITDAQTKTLSIGTVLKLPGVVKNA